MRNDLLPRYWWTVIDTGTAHAFPWGVFDSLCGLAMEPPDARWYGAPPSEAHACRTCLRLSGKDAAEALEPELQRQEDAEEGGT